MLLGPLFNQLLSFQKIVEGSFYYSFASPKTLKAIMAVVLLTGLLCKRNYVLSLVMFLVVLMYHHITHPVINGGDQVVLFYMFLGVFCNNRPSFSEESIIRLFQDALNNFCILIAQIQVALIYLVSGWDKLNSETWIDGTAIFNLLQVDFYPTNWLQALTEGVDLQTLVMVSWLVIAFELLFPLLVWIPGLRYWMLSMGILFHLFIALGLSLPDFALIMIWTYVIFVKQKDFNKVIKMIRKITDSLSKRLKSISKTTGT